MKIIKIIAALALGLYLLGQFGGEFPIPGMDALTSFASDTSLEGVKDMQVGMIAVVGGLGVFFAWAFKGGK